MELTDYWRIIRAHWLAIVAITVAGALIGFGWALLQPKVYTANASGIVSVGVSSDLGTAMAGENYAKSRVKSYLDLAKSRSVSEAAIKTLGVDANPDALISRIAVTNPIDTSTLKVSAEADTPEEARALAEAWVGAIGTEVNRLENANIDETNPEAKPSIVKFQTLDAAQMPSGPSSPNTKLAIGIGLLVGLALAVGYALLRNIFDRRIHSIAEVERETELSVIGTIPLHSDLNADNRIITSSGGNDTGEKADRDYAVAEALRELRTNLQFMNIDDPPRSIVITSALPGEGKSTITANLANTIAATGRNVVVIDGDLRRPMVAKTFGLLPGVGLTDVLIGNAELADVLQPWGTTGKLWVLGAGKVPPNPSELLGSKAMQKLIEDLAEHAIVLIDAPPLLPVTDAAILTARTDGAMVVSRARKTTYDALKAAIENLTRVNGHPLGIILNGVPSKGVRAEGYGYKYRGYYGRQQQNEATVPQESQFKEFSDLLREKQAAAAPAAAASSVHTTPAPQAAAQSAAPSAATATAQAPRTATATAPATHSAAAPRPATAPAPAAPAPAAAQAAPARATRSAKTADGELPPGPRRRMRETQQ